MNTTPAALAVLSFFTALSAAQADIGSELILDDWLCSGHPLRGRVDPGNPAS